jgi:hypothetical protein
MGVLTLLTLGWGQTLDQTAKGRYMGKHVAPAFKHLNIWQ